MSVKSDPNLRRNWRVRTGDLEARKGLSWRRKRMEIWRKHICECRQEGSSGQSVLAGFVSLPHDALLYVMPGIFGLDFGLELELSKPTGVADFWFL